MATHQPATPPQKNPPVQPTVQTPATKAKPDTLRSIFGTGEWSKDRTYALAAVGLLIILIAGFDALGTLVGVVVCAVSSSDCATSALLGQITPGGIGQLFAFYLATFPLTTATTIFMLFVFDKQIKSYVGFLISVLVTLFLATWLGGALGIGGVSIGDLTSALLSATIPWYEYPFAAILFFLGKYGALRFFDALITGIVIAWIFHFKILPHLAKKSTRVVTTTTPPAANKP